MDRSQINIQSRDFWFKIVSVLGQNWALTEGPSGGSVKTYFLHDRSGAFDEISFSWAQDAAVALLRNGCRRYVEDQRAKRWCDHRRRPSHHDSSRWADLLIWSILENGIEFDRNLWGEWATANDGASFVTLAPDPTVKARQAPSRTGAGSMNSFALFSADRRNSYREGPMSKFSVLFHRIEEHFHVDLIAQPVDVAPPDLNLDEAIAWGRKRHYDFVPLGRREPDGAASVESIVEPRSQRKRPVEMQDLIADSTPLPRAFELLDERPFRLVLEGDRIRSIVTISDLNLLPVRVLLFTILAHTEMLLTNRIDRAHPDNTWMQFLGRSQQEGIQDLQKMKRELDVDTRLLDCVSLGQKCSIVEASAPLRKELGYATSKEFKRARKPFERARNRLFHHEPLVGANQSSMENEPPEDGLRDAISHHDRIVVEPNDVKWLRDCVVQLRDWIMRMENAGAGLQDAQGGRIGGTLPAT